MSNHTKAIDGIQEAQKIAFSPFVFQATVAVRKLGVFNIIFSNRKKGGISIDAISTELGISAYGGKPKGLKELGNWKTIYEGLPHLSPAQQKAWFEFDPYYSDDIFAEALEIVFKKERKTMFDIGANTGKFTIRCCKFNDQVSITMVDLPGQLNMALSNVKNEGLQARVKVHEIDWLYENPQIPMGTDTLWMCQFLDCFSKEGVLKVLKSCVGAMDSQTELITIETFTDRQKFDNAKFILEATSLYFTVLANGNSKMYKVEEFKTLAELAGLKLKEDIVIGEYHTMFTFCKN